MSAAQRTGLSIVLGVVLGWLVFSAIPHPPFAWFGWLGIPVGGLFAWLVVDLKQVGHAISKTWCQMRSVKIDPEIVRERWQMIWLSFRVWLATSSSLTVLIICVAALIGLVKGEISGTFVSGTFSVIIVFSIAFFIVFGWTGVFSETPSRSTYTRDNLQEVLFLLNPYTVYIKWFAWELIISTVILKFPVYMCWFGRFLWRVYVMLHERRRTIALVVTVMVTTVLYLVKLTTHSLPFWTLPAGAVVGYLLGLAEYEVVAKRWLHVVPAASA